MPVITAFFVHCPPMRVVNTGWTPTSDRLTDELPSPTKITTPSSSLDALVIYPPCKVTFQSPGHWLVQAFRASIESTDRKKVYGYIDYPAEPVERRGRLMAALEIKSTGGLITIGEGTVGFVDNTIKESLADPFPFWKGGPLAGYTVRAVVCPGTISWR